MKKGVYRFAVLALVLSLLISVVPAAFAETTVDTIMTVGTTQAFTDETVPEEDIRTILQAGLAAESAINQQPWFFVALTDQEVMKEISGSGMPFGAPGGAPGSAPGAAPGKMEGKEPPKGDMPPMATGAKASVGDSPLAILVYVNEKSMSPNPSFDCGLAVQNMYLAAVSLGYGAKVVSSPTNALNGEKHDEFCVKFGVDPEMKAVAVLLIGKADTSVDATSSASVREGLESKTSIIG